MTPFLGQRDHPAQPLEQIVALDDAQRVEVVDRRTEHDGDEAVDMPAGAITASGMTPRRSNQRRNMR